MGKINRAEAIDLISENLEQFAELLGLEFHPYSNRITGTVKEKFVKGSDLSNELTKETKDVTRNSIDNIFYYYWGKDTDDKKEQEATILGKINAIADHLGVTFEVQPEKVVTKPVKVVAVKKATAKKSKVTAKKGKK